MPLVGTGVGLCGNIVVAVSIASPSVYGWEVVGEGNDGCSGIPGEVSGSPKVVFIVRVGQ